MPPKKRIPKRGEIWSVDFNPSAGAEMMNRHFALVLSDQDFNSVVPLTYIAPISTASRVARNTGYQVNLTGAGTRTTGVIDLTQVRSLDLSARQSSFVETAPDFIVDEALARITSVFED
jgi:mRNA-degrading endonuclease toxin of MazEF toxin-antitoxin module